MSLNVNFSGKFNGNPIEFKQEGPATLVMNGGKLTAEEIGLVENSLDIMLSVFKRDKAALPKVSFNLKGEGNSLLINTKSGDAVFEGKLEGTINGTPFEFKPAAGVAIAVNNGELSDSEIKGIEFGFNQVKSAVGRGKR